MTEQKTEPTVEYKNGTYWMGNVRGRMYVAELTGDMMMVIDKISQMRGGSDQHLAISESDLAALLRAMGWGVEPPARERTEP